MKIALLTFYTPDFQPLADLTIPNKEAFCKVAGYEHVVKVGPYSERKCYYAIDRLIFLKDLLYASPTSIEVVWVLNLHTAIMNTRKRLEELLSEEHDFFIAADCNGLNAGSFVVRKTEWAKRWITFVIDQALASNHHWYEQKVMQDHASTAGWRERIRILPQNAINSYDYRLYNMSEATTGHFQKGDFVFHAPGIAFYETCGLLEARVKLFSGDWIKDNMIR